MTYKQKEGPFSVLKVLIISITILTLSFSVFAEEEKSWTVGAIAFTYSQDVKRSEYEKAILKTVPVLILEQLHGLKVRNVPADEILDRKVDDLVKERLSLFLELSKESKVRDTYVLQNLSDYQFKKKVAESEKKIAEIQKKIESNLEAQDKLISENKNIKPVSENFALYKNESESLFEFSLKEKDVDYYSYPFSAEVTKAGINGLITGSLVTYGNYAAVSCELILYPGAKSCGVVTEVGSIARIDTIAKNIAYRLIPKIENSIPCEVTVNLKNEELRSKSKLTIDSTIYDPIPHKLVLSSGVHNLTFECEGYRRESFSYGFGYEKKYIIDLDFVENNPINTAFSLKKPINGSVFYNGKNSEENVISVKVNNQGVLGFYLTENNNTLFFRISEKYLVNDGVVSLNLKDIDVGANIEKRRKIMYISYSALICSLPYLFYSYSNYNSLYTAYVKGNTNIDRNEIQTYQTMTYIGIGISAGIGCWFIYELVNYLIAANKALPVEAKPSVVSYEEAVSGYESMKAMFKAMEEEEQKRKEAEQQAEAEKQKLLEEIQEQNPESQTEIKTEEKQ